MTKEERKEEDRFAFGGHREAPPLVLDWDTKYEKALKKIRDMEGDNDGSFSGIVKGWAMAKKMQKIAKNALEAK